MSVNLALKISTLIHFTINENKPSMFNSLYLEVVNLLTTAPSLSTPTTLIMYVWKLFLLTKNTGYKILRIERWKLLVKSIQMKNVFPSIRPLTLFSWQQSLRLWRNIYLFGKQFAFVSASGLTNRLWNLFLEDWPKIKEGSIMKNQSFIRNTYTLYVIKQGPHFS